MDSLRLTSVIQKHGVKSAFIQAVVFIIHFISTYILYSCRSKGEKPVPSHILGVKISGFRS